MKKLFRTFLCTIAMSMCFSITSLAASSLDGNSHIQWSATGEAWTFPVTGSWTEKGTTIEVAPIKGLPALKAGEHYYEKDIETGTISISSWRVAHQRHTCIHNSYTDKNPWMGVSYNQHNCFGILSSGWLATCADCGKVLGNLFYGQAEDIKTVTSIPAKSTYYSLCVHCNNLEQGTPVKHTCQAVSANVYTVKYEENGAVGYMKDSIFTYNNATTYDGETITPDTALRANTFRRSGYEFAGWNTRPDGSGTPYADKQTVLNIAGRDADRQVVTLYAQWTRSQSTLVINPNGGTYNGTTATTRITQDYGTTYNVSNPSPKSGYNVYFNSMGGTGVGTKSTSTTFTGWSQNSDFHGKLIQQLYQFIGANGTQDTLTANYSQNGITLPSCSRSGYNFTGWYYDTSCREFAGKANSAFTPTGNVTLYAGWAQLNLTANDNYSANGGKGAVNLSWAQNDGLTKTYKIFQSRDNANWAELHGATQLGNTLSASKTFGFTNTQQSYTVPYTGLYTLSAYGAQGGNYSGRIGGYGGYISGDVFLKKGEVVYVTVGGQNSYNGGGGANAGGNGGGMTSISTNLKGTIMIAGGGGGASSSGNGGAGGAATSIIGGNNGGSGAVGGGAGGNGGSAGANPVYHYHSASCYVNTSYDALNAYDVSIGKSYEQSRENQSNGSIQRRGLTVTQQNGSAIPTKGNTTVRIKGYFKVDTGGYFNYKDSNYIVVRDQYGNQIYGINLQNILDAEKNLLTSNGVLYAPCVLYDNCTSYNLSQEGEFDGNGNWYDTYKEFQWIRNFGNNQGGLYKVNHNQNRGFYDYRKWSSNSQSFQDIGTFEIPPFNDFLSLRNWNEFANKSFSFSAGTRYWATKAIGYVIDVPIPSYVNGISIYLHACYKEERGFGNEAINVDCIQFSGAQQVVCGMANGQQIVPASPAYGGTNWVNSTYVRNSVSYSGQKAGNGSSSLVSKNLGYMDASYLNDVTATDYAAPNAMNAKLITMAPAGNNNITLTWANPGDNGTPYYHKVDSYSLNSGTSAYSMTSNITKNVLTTGVTNYRVIVDTSSNTIVTASNSEYVAGNSYTLGMAQNVRYLHVAAQDRTGNVGGTAHYTIPAVEQIAVDWSVYTGQMFISGEEGNVYQTSDGRYFVKADGETPFKAWYTGYVNGVANVNYQIDTAYFMVNGPSGEESIMANVPKASSMSDVTYKGSDISTQYTTPDYLKDTAYSVATRNGSLKQLTMEYKFAANPSYNGTQAKLYPRVSAYNSRTGQTNTSDNGADTSHGLTIVLDGAAPVISGLEVFDGLTEVDRQNRNITANISATDALSGMESLEITVLNNDNQRTQTFSSNGSRITLNLTENSLLFIGDISVTVTATDKVGNIATYGYNVINYTLETNLDKMREPHGREFKAAETGTLYMDSTGYIDKIVVEFPEELTRYDSTLNHTYTYSYDESMYHNYNGLAENGIVHEELEFAVPLETKDGNYQIKITAYDNGRLIDSLTRYEDFTVKGSVLDELVSIIEWTS